MGQKGGFTLEFVPTNFQWVEDLYQVDIEDWFVFIRREMGMIDRDIGIDWEKSLLTLLWLSLNIVMPWWYYVSKMH